ncbi:hypothetical protein [Streptomyces sp. DH12]|uniref:hypothetical protein n=1 Tax=Streptomyces sp. DH12 TaxID=2857010 RepID=UPI001E59DAD2|nr:hypothetical protein [Streptomyces sp. DH12]
MTIKVYEVRKDGTTATVRERQDVEPAADAPVSMAYPPCTCPRCRGAAPAEAAR